MSWPEAFSWRLRLSSRSCRSALDGVLSRAALGPATEAPAVGSLAVKDMLRPVGSATALSRSDSSILRYNFRHSVDVVCAIKSSQLSRLKSANRLCPLNRSTLLYARTEIPSLSAQLSAEMERHLLPPRCSTPPPREGGLVRDRPRGEIYSQNGWHYVKEHPRITQGRPHYLRRSAGRYRTAIIHIQHRPPELRR